MTITDFLEARIAEDEAAVDRRGDIPHAIHQSDAYGAYNPQCADCLGIAGRTRVVVESAAKRAIIEQAGEATSDRYSVISEYCVGQSECDEAMATDPGDLILRHLAAVYADHPDYDKGWAL